VFATERIEARSFIVEYCGELITNDEGQKREDIQMTGFRYFFTHRGKKYWSVY